jgi:hypothetical protein
MMARKIGVSVHFIPLHTQPYYRDKYELQPNTPNAGGVSAHPVAADLCSDVGGVSGRDRRGARHRRATADEAPTDVMVAGSGCPAVALFLVITILIRLTAVARRCFARAARRFLRRFTIRQVPHHGGGRR